MDIVIPEASLIDIRRIIKRSQNKWLDKINYSKLFNLSWNYVYPKTESSFSIPEGYLGCLSKVVINDFLTSSIDKGCYHVLNGGYYYSQSNNPDYLFAIRPVFKYSEIKKYCKVVKELAPGYLLITFGEYPSKKNNEIKAKYSYLWQRIKTHPTGNKYTLLKIEDKEITAKEYPEVIFDGTENRVVIKDEDIYEVAPIYFLVDVKKDFAISRDIMFCLPTLKKASEITSIKDTLPYEFLNNYFAPELMQNIIRQNTEKNIESEENPLIKDLINNILELIKNSCLEDIIKKELQELINEYNNNLEKEKEETLNLKVGLSSEEKFIKKLESLTLKITNFPYYNISKIILSCLTNTPLEITSELYNDIAFIFNCILPTLPENLQKNYEDKIKEILEAYKNEIINLYQNLPLEKVNIELKIREKIQPILESLYQDVTTNYISINLAETIKGIYRSTNDKYLSYLFALINEVINEVEILIVESNLKSYKEELNAILNTNVEKNFSSLIRLYIDITKLKAELEENINKRTKIERKKIRRRLI